MNEHKWSAPAPVLHEQFNVWINFYEHILSQNSMEQLLNKPCIEAKFASFVSCAEMLGQMLYMITIVINGLVDHFRDDLNFCFAMSASNGECINQSGGK